MEEVAAKLVADYPSVIEILKAFGPPLVAGVAAVIALMAATMASIIQYNQWKTAKEKLRSDLFDRRMAIYNQVFLALVEMRNRGSVPQDELRALKLALNSARFLFPSDLYAVLERFEKIFGQYRGWFGRWQSEGNKDLPDRELLGELVEKMRIADVELDRMTDKLSETFHGMLYFGNI